LDQAIVALRDSKEENMEVRGYLETLMAKSQQLEEKVNYLMACRGKKQSEEMNMQSKCIKIQM
jgi:hypothetical protein